MKKMKQMCYMPERIEGDILYSGIYKNVEFIIVSYGTHPCAYVKVPDNISINEYDIECNGGITFNEVFDKDFKFFTCGHWIGWDYAHYTDYMGYYELPSYNNLFYDSKKWTTEEIYNEVKHVINNLKIN